MSADLITVGRVDAYEGELPSTYRLPALVVVPCTSTKADRPARVDELYKGGTFTLGLRAARMMGGGRTRVLSALHGLVHTHDELDPYDVTLGDDLAVDAAVVAGQLVGREGLAGSLEPVVIVSLLPRRYRLLLEAAVAHAQAELGLGPVEVIDGLAGCGGIGAQRGRLRQLADGELLLTYWRDVAARPPAVIVNRRAQRAAAAANDDGLAELAVLRGELEQLDAAIADTRAERDRLIGRLAEAGVAKTVLAEVAGVSRMTVHRATPATANGSSS